MKVLRFEDFEVDGIDTDDYPDFVDAFVVSATAVLEDGSTREATEAELEELSDDRDLVMGLVYARLY